MDISKQLRLQIDLNGWTFFLLAKIVKYIFFSKKILIAYSIYRYKHISLQTKCSFLSTFVVFVCYKWRIKKNSQKKQWLNRLFIEKVSHGFKSSKHCFMHKMFSRLRNYKGILAKFSSVWTTSLFIVRKPVNCCSYKIESGM